MGAKSHGGSFRRETSFRESCVDGRKVRAFRLVARLFEKMVSDSRVLVGSKSGCFGGSLRREFDFRESAVGGRKVTAFRWLAFARRWFSGVGCGWERSHMVARVGEKMVFGTRLLVGAKL